jgi:hypothetical protein
MKSPIYFTVSIPREHKMSYEMWHTATIEEARELAKKSEHSKILNHNGIFVQ